MAENKIDLNDLAQSQNLKLSLATVEDSTERESRLRIAEADALHLRSKELLICESVVEIRIDAKGFIAGKAQLTRKLKL